MSPAISLGHRIAHGLPKRKRRYELPMVWERGKIVPKKNEKEMIRLELTEAERQ